MLSVILQAQYAEDALRYSQIFYQGTARNMATGNVMGSLGADFSALSTNPGGLGIFRNNEFSISPEVFNQKVTAIYNGTAADESKTMFAFSNLGIVFSKELGRGAKGWKYLNYAFGMNRLNNFNSNSTIQGFNPDNSKIDVYLDQTANFLNDGNSISDIQEKKPFDLWPAWETYLIDTITTEGQLYLVSPVPQGGLMQHQHTQTKGSNNEWLASIGGNFNDRLYIGATLGLPYIRYFSEINYAETDSKEQFDDFNNWSVTEFLNTNGWGVNFKIGVVARPVDWMRVGIAYHTPTYFWSMKDSWYTVTTSDIYAFSMGGWHTGNYESPTGEYKYKLTTPMRFIADVGFVIKNFGFIAGAYEYANYSQSRFKANDYGFDEENANIKSFYSATNNFRAGTEWRYSKFSFRAGYALYASPYRNNLNDGKRQSFSGGLGFKYSSYSFDFAYVYSKMDENYYLYSTETITTNPVTKSNISQNFVLTFRYQY